MELKHLTNYHGLENYLHIGWYFPLNHYQKVKDPISQSILKFKECDNLTVNAWCYFVVSVFSGIKFKIDLILRMQSSHEITSDKMHPLSQIGYSLEQNLDNAKFSPDLLFKTRSVNALHRMSSSNRKQEIKGAYAYKGFDDVRCPNILVIDDILTTGTSMREVSRAIKKIQPNCNIFNFTLLKTYDKRFDPYGVPNTEIYYCNFINFKEIAKMNGSPLNNTDELSCECIFPF
jgi:predicted amidophosphoribosyltransferase